MTEPQPAPVLAALLLPMPEIRTVTTLRRKRDEISASIRLYEKKLDQARADLAHVTAAARIFAGLTDRKTFPAVRTPIACSTGASHGPAAPLGSPRRRRQRSELALALMNAKGLDLAEAVLAKAIGHRFIPSLRMQRQRDRVRQQGMRKGVSVWRLPDTKRQF